MSTQTRSSDAITISKSSIRRLGLILGAIVALAIIVALVVALVENAGSKDSLAAAIKSNEYQAVFLTNNQVFFGKLEAHGDFYYLRNVYTLQSQASAVRGQPPSQTFVKLTAAIHSPEDLMVISRSQILYVENLNPSGKAAKLLSSGAGP